MHMINAKDPYVCKMVRVLELCGWLNFEWQDPPAPRHWIGLNHWSNTRVLLHTSYDMDWIGFFAGRKKRYLEFPPWGVDLEKEYYPALLKAVAERSPEHLEEAKKILS